MILRTTDIAGIFKSNPGMPSLKEHFEHGLPKIDRRNGLGPDFSFFRFGFIVYVLILESFTIKVVQIRNFITAEKCPILPGFHSLHEQVGYPVCRVHVVSAPTVVTGIFSEL